MGKLSNDEFLRRLRERNSHYADGEFEVLGEYAGISTPLRCRCLVCGDIWDGNPDSMLRRNSRCPKCGEDAGGIDISHGMSDYGAETPADVLLGEAVVSLGHALPFSPLRSRIAIFWSCGRLLPRKTQPKRWNIREVGRREKTLWMRK